MPKLIVQQGNYEAGGEINLEKEMFIGRDEGCDIVLPDGLVSRQHARLKVDGSKAFVEDLSSYNGTFLNWIPIVEKSQLKHLDVLQIGKNVFVYADGDMQEGQIDGERPESTVGFTIEFLRNTVHKIEQNVQQVFKGKNDIVRNVLLCMLADGHVLVEDSPGVGKTILAQALAKSIQGSFKRIQFTPDMLPSDIIGISIYHEDTKDFKLIPGPIFGNIILADEINRTTPRTQSSLRSQRSDPSTSSNNNRRSAPISPLAASRSGPSAEPFELSTCSTATAARARTGPRVTSAGWSRLEVTPWAITRGVPPRSGHQLSGVLHSRTPALAKQLCLAAEEPQERG